MSDTQEPLMIECTAEENAALKYDLLQVQAAQNGLAAAQSRYEADQARVLLAHHTEIGDTPIDALRLIWDQETASRFAFRDSRPAAPLAALPQPREDEDESEQTAPKTRKPRERKAVADPALAKALGEIALVKQEYVNAPPATAMPLTESESEKVETAHAGD